MKRSPFSILRFAWIALIVVPLLAISQQATVEQIAKILPPVTDKGIRLDNGSRQVTLRGNYLFITNYWGGIQVVDVSDIQNPRDVVFIPLDNEAYHTYVDDKYLYVANHDNGVQVFDIQDITRPKPFIHLKTPGNAMWVYAEYPRLYVALGEDGFGIYDLSNTEHPTTLALEIVDSWVGQIYKQDNLLYVAGKKGGVLIYDVSDPENPQRLARYRTNYQAVMVQVDGETAFVADGPGGLLLLDVKNPRFPQPLKRVKTGGYIIHLFKMGNYVYLANRNLGLQIVNVTDLKNPVLAGQYLTESECYGVFKQDIYVYLAANTATLIMRHNNAPVLNPIPDFTLKEGEAFQYQVSAVEPDGDPIVFSASNLPEGSQFDPETHIFSWTPTYEQSGVYPNVIFRVEEQTASKLSDADTVQITVEHVNRLPDLPAIADTSIDENKTLQFTIPEGSDPDKEDQQRLRYRAENLPPGATFDPETRVFSWTPTFEQSGVYVVDFILDDGAGGVDREPVKITVRHVDRKPTIEAIADQVIDENQTLTLELNGTDPDKEDQDKISFAMENLPEGATFDPETRTFRWTPTYEQSGVYENITAIMIAGAMSDTTRFTITVNHVNRPPVLAEIGDKTVDEAQLLEFQIQGKDPDKEDQGKLTFSAENLPEGATFDPQTQTFRWTPTYEQSGTYPDVTFAVSDPAGLTDRKRITITVNHVNRPPEIAAVADQTVNENETLSFQLTASDPDKEDAGKLTFSALDLPAGAQLDPASGRFDWTPTYEQSGTYTVTFIVSDGQYSDSTRSTITVLHVNRPPELAAIGSLQVDENQLLEFTLEGKDPDQEDAGQLTFYATNLPEGARFDPATRTFSWTPTYEQSGTYTVTFGIKDPAGLTDEETVTITVNHVNRAPTLEPIADQTVNENEPLTLQLVGSDPDEEDSGKLQYRIRELPEGATIDPATGQFSWTPSYEQAGRYSLTATVTDPAGLSASQTFQIVVNNVNRPPVMEPISEQTIDENQDWQFTIPVSDPDPEDQGKLVVTVENLPEGAQFDADKRTIRWKPTYEQSGEYPLTATVTDPGGLTASQSFRLVVNHVNRPPTLDDIDNQEVDENQTLTLTFQASDPDKEDAGKLTFRVDNLPAGAQFDASTATLSWTPGYDQAGEYSLTVTVSDPAGGQDSKTFTIKVNNVNRPPTLSAPTEKTVKEGETLRFQLTASDPDREDQGKLTFSAKDLPSGARLDKTTGVFEWVPGKDQQGSYTIEFVVKDSGGLRATATTTITVEDVPEETENPPQ
ncbi:MAG: tandem-95 repeat protein [Calditrichaeota bacterium]|nr:tandem-95 repeat protein [Calditrichota bacterium]